MATGADHPFGKDLAYLGPFLERLSRHVGSMNGAAGDRLRALLAGEAERWSAIEAALAGGDVPAAAPPAAASATPAMRGTSPTVGSLAKPGPEPRASQAQGLTVGNLRHLEPPRRRADD